MIHKTEVPAHADSWTELAEELGDLRYDALSTFLQALSKKMHKDADADSGRQRRQLAKELYAAADDLQSAAEAIARAWVICEPFMEKTTHAEEQ